MSKLVWAVLGCGLFFSQFALAGEWSKTFSISERPILRVESSDANIRLDTWDQKNIEAKVTTDAKIGEGGVRVVDHQAGDAVEIEVRLPRRSGNFDGHSPRVDIEIHMPRQGSVSLRTSDGDIRVSNLKGNLDSQTGDGAQEIEAVDGNLKAHTGDGRIRVTGRFDGLDLSSGDGEVEARAEAGSKVDSGWNLKSGDGSINLSVPANFAADVELHTGDGQITLDMPLTMEGQMSRQNIRGKLNGGGNLLLIHTGDGSIRLGKS